MTGPLADFVRTNVHGTAQPARRGSSGRCARVVHVSSPSVAHTGDSLVGAGAGPADPQHARGQYARSKAVAEQLALEPRPALPSSPSGRIWSGGRATPSWSGASSTGRRSGRLAVVGSGCALIDTTYVDNAVDALVAAVDRVERSAGRAFVVSNGEPRPVAELVRRDLRRGRRGAAAAARPVPGWRRRPAPPPRPRGPRCGGRTTRR